jgi:hypothetical protein
MFSPWISLENRLYARNSVSIIYKCFGYIKGYLELTCGIAKNAVKRLENR